MRTSCGCIWRGPTRYGRPEHGVPTSYYTAVQLRCRAVIVDDNEEKFAILSPQLGHFEPDGSTRETPSAGIESDRRLVPGIRGLRLTIESVQAKMKYGGNPYPPAAARRHTELESLRA